MMANPDHMEPAADLPSVRDRLGNFGFLIIDVSRLFGLNFEREAKDLNLTLRQCKVLVSLRRNEGISQARLAELSAIDPMTLVRVLDCMERDGWVERRQDPADRRARRRFMKPRRIRVSTRSGALQIEPSPPLSLVFRRCSANNW